MACIPIANCQSRIANAWVIGVLACASIAAGPPTQPATTQRKAPLDEAPREFPSLKEVITGQEAPIDQELAARIIQRQEMPAGGAALVDLGIDVRIVERWFLAQAAAAKPESEAQIHALLRTPDIADAIKLMEADQKSGWTPTRTQTDAMGRLHKLTFELAELKDAAQLDDISRKFATELVLISSATPIDPKSLPSMRPSRVRFDTDDTAKPTTKEALRSVADLQGEVTRAAISLPLRKQLLAMAKAAASGDEKDAAALHQALAEGVDLARGLSSTTAFSAEAKEQIETQLAQGLALVSDSRTRAAGEERIQALNEYRLVMNRIARSKLPAEVRKALEPAFAYAQTHAAEGAKVLNLIGEFTDVIAKVDALPKRDNPVANVRAATTEVGKQVAAARQAFIAAANDLSSASGGGVAAMEEQLGELRELADLYALLATIQQTYDTLNAYKPRPFGMIEQRASRAATVAAATIKSPLRTDGIRFLNDLARLARLSDAVTTKSLAEIPPAVMQSYAGVSTAEFSAKVKLLMADLINSAAAGQEPDRKKVDRLNAVDQMVDALHSAAAFEQNVDSVTQLQRWVDWKLESDQVKAMVVPYQQLIGDAFSGFMTDSPSDGVERFLRLRKNYAPVMSLMERDAKQADACGALPEGLQGDLARLMTPLHDQPFATERYVSYGMMTWSMLNDNDAEAAQSALAAVMRRLVREFPARPQVVKSTAPATRGK